MHSRTVWITGIGAVTALGSSMTETWEALLQGKSGISRIEAFDPDEYDLKVKIAGEIKRFDPEQWMEGKVADRLDRFSQFALVAAKEAISEAHLPPLGSELLGEVGVIVGTGIGGFSTINEQLYRMWQRGTRAVRPLTVPKIMANAASSAICRSFGFRGPSFAISTACASGADAIGHAMRIIQRGETPVMIAGGSEALITPFGITVFQNMKALTEDFNDDPTRGSRPFDKQRSGFVLAEGAAIVVLEDADFARNRGVTPIAEISGYAQTTDVYHITAPDPEGREAIRAIQKALYDARVGVSKVTYINAHGTSTPLNDRAETTVIRSVFGAYTDEIPVSSTKSMTGHLLGAAGALEAAICAKVVETGWAPCTINLENIDPDCELDHIRITSGVPRGAAISNSFGFGGHNAVLVLQAP